MGRLKRRLSARELKRRARDIQCLFLDVDGVVTDCKLWLGPDGMELKAVDVKDGLGMKLLLKAGVELVVISGRPSPAMHARFTFLGIKHIHLNTEDKLPAYEKVRAQLALPDAACAVMGDDAPDVPLMQRAGLAFAVADAHPCALAQAHWVSRLPGGNGAVREACDLLLAARTG